MNISKYIFILSFSLIFTLHAFSQVSVNQDNSDPDSSAMLDVKSTDKGILIPRMTTAQRNMISSPAMGLLVFDTDTESFWFRESGGWVKLGGSGPSDEISDADSDTKVQVEESADEDQVRFDLGGTEYFVMNSGRIHVRNTGGSVFLGDSAGANENLANHHNVFIGEKAGKNNNKSENIAIGFEALEQSSQGNGNIALGIGALRSNSSDYATAIGSYALYSNTTGAFNVAVGRSALQRNTTGFANVAIGTFAGSNNQTGGKNTLIGQRAGEGTGIHNKEFNVMVGYHAGIQNEGNGNIFLGYESGFSELGDNKLYIENSFSSSPLIYGEFDNDVLRTNGKLEVRDYFQKLGSSSNEGDVYIANYELKFVNTGQAHWSVRNDSATGRFEIASTSASAVPGIAGSNRMVILPSGDTGIGTNNPGVKFQVGTNGDGTIARANAWNTFSDQRWKTDIEEIDNPLEKINALNGYYYKWKEGQDQSMQIGVLAQEVEAVLPEIVATDANGYKSVDYSKLSALLIEGMQEVIKEKNHQITDLQSQLDALSLRLNKLEK